MNQVTFINAQATRLAVAQSWKYTLAAVHSAGSVTKWSRSLSRI